MKRAPIAEASGKILNLSGLLHTMRESITVEGPLTLDASCLKMSFESIERGLLDAHNAIEEAIDEA